MPGIQNFPMRNQLHDIVRPTDGAPDDNQDYHCVPESIAACIQSETGIKVAAEDLEDAAYSENHRGGGSALVYDNKHVDERYHVELEYFEGDRPALIGEIKRQLDNKIPVLVTMPSAWNTRHAPNDNVDHPGNSFGTHVGVAHWYSGNQLYVMNPWGGFEQIQTFAWWQARLCYRSVWPVVRIGVSPVTLDINQVSGFFEQVSATEWKCKQTGESISQAMLDFYRNIPVQLGGLTVLGLPKSGKLYKGNVAVQVFERGAIVYDPNREYDNPPGAQGQCYFGHIDGGLVLDFLTPAPAPQPAPQTELTDQDKADLALANAVRTWMKGN